MIEFKEIDRAEAIRYLGAKGSVYDENLKKLLDKCEAEILSFVSPKYVYRIFEIDRVEGLIKLIGTDVKFTGQDIKNHLVGCNSVAVMAVTLSGNADMLIKEKSVTDMAEAVTVDALCSALTEQLCDLCQEEISKISDMQTTERYSPGYGDFPISFQKDIIKVTDAERRIGLSANDSYMLIPSKSVTAIIGLSNQITGKKKKSCEGCNLKDSCEYRKRGDSCGV